MNILEKLFKINLKSVTCPECQTKLPYFRKPQNTQQALWGGYTCSNCKTELDRFGAKVS